MSYVRVIDLNTFEEKDLLSDLLLGSPKMIFSSDSTRVYLLVPERHYVFDTATYTEIADADLLGAGDFA
ncbi:YncE family protein, partial [Bacillus vallismortis]|nr:YncE family protein [Bacillus vallismortis]